MSVGRELSDGTLVFPQRGQPPAEAAGYMRDPGNPYNLLPIWEPCKHRSTGIKSCDCPGENYTRFPICGLGLQVGARQCRECPKRVDGESALDIQHGTEMWGELHRNTQPSKGWLTAFLSRLPKSEWEREAAAYINQNPPPIRDEQAFFEWTVEWHNAINAKNGKPIIDLVQARKRWRR